MVNLLELTYVLNVMTDVYYAMEIQQIVVNV